MSSRSVHLVSDFNVDLLASTLRRVLGDARSVHAEPFGQVHQVLGSSEVEAPHQDSTMMVWTRPEAVIESFGRALRLERVDHARAIAEAEQYVRALGALARRYRYVLHPTWTIPSSKRLYGIVDWKPGTGVRYLLGRLNTVLAGAMSEASNIYLLDADTWIRAAGPKAYAPKLELITKTPFAASVFTAAASDVRDALSALDGHARKLIVLDLDNTLWGGIVGEDGPANLRLGGHDATGEAFVAFQRSLLALTRRGIQLAIASKNDEALALNVIDTHPEMVLRRDHFAGWRINWNDKAVAIAELSRELRLGTSAFVFIDDNPAERSRIAGAFPEVLVPDWPADPALYASALDSLTCFDVPQITDEDFGRTASQVAERQRRASQPAAVDSMEGWLQSLETQVQVEPLSAVNLPRIAQLFGKTNQMNLTTRRLTAAEIEASAHAPGRCLWAIRVQDRFGDSGLTGVIAVALEDRVARVTDMILSCRVMGRKVENAMLHLASVYAAEHDAELHVEYRPTDRNAPCLKVLEESGLSRRSDTLFVWDKPVPFEPPAAISLVR